MSSAPPSGIAPANAPARRPRRAGVRVRRAARAAFLYGAMIVALVAILAPFAWLLISSVAEPVDLLQRPLQWIPAHITFQRFADLTVGYTADDSALSFRAAFINSTVIALSLIHISEPTRLGMI